MAISFILFSFMSLLISGGRTSDLCRFSFVCSVVLGFSSVLVLVFTLVFIQGSICFVSVECILLGFLEMLAIRLLLNLSFFFYSFLVFVGGSAILE